MEKYRVGILGATGMVGQRLLCLLENHPFFDVTALAAGPRSAGRTFSQATAGRWKIKTAAPARCTNMPVFDAVSEMEKIRERVDFVFCAVDMPKEDVLALEEMYARAEVPVVSNNSANRWTPDVPMLIPEINAAHIALIAAQRRRLGTRRGFVVVKPNCSIQSYVPALTPLRRFGLERVSVTTFQAVSGAGHTLADMPQIIDNVIPYIPGEEEKSEREPLRVWGTPKDGAIELAAAPVISAQCLRVTVSDGHMAAV
ncbi:MAG: aspartate-semialdehyde dehydrogenase [Clostridia bacterium]|nr:aspartate-semialdehyde dehydrogenase [Clostridia bacterium]